MNTADVLKAARELIVERGWWQFVDGQYVGETDGVCVAQAVMTVTGEDYVAQVPAFQCLADAMSVSLVYEWNDTPGRTKAEVLAMLFEVEMTERARMLPVVREQVVA